MQTALSVFVRQIYQTASNARFRAFVLERAAANDEARFEAWARSLERRALEHHRWAPNAAPTPAGDHEIAPGRAPVIGGAGSGPEGVRWRVAAAESEPPRTDNPPGDAEERDDEADDESDEELEPFEDPAAEPGKPI